MSIWFINLLSLILVLKASRKQPKLYHKDKDVLTMLLALKIPMNYPKVVHLNISFNNLLSLIPVLKTSMNQQKLYHKDKDLLTVLLVLERSLNYLKLSCKEKDLLVLKRSMTYLKLFNKDLLLVLNVPPEYLIQQSPVTDSSSENINEPEKNVQSDESSTVAVTSSTVAVTSSTVAVTSSTDINEAPKNISQKYPLQVSTVITSNPTDINKSVKDAVQKQSSTDTTTSSEIKKNPDREREPDRVEVSFVGMPEVITFLDKLKEDRRTKRATEDARRSEEHSRWKSEDEERVKEDEILAEEDAKERNQELACSRGLCLPKAKKDNTLNIKINMERREKEDKQRQEEKVRQRKEDERRKEEDERLSPIENLLKPISPMSIKSLSYEEIKHLYVKEKLQALHKQEAESTKRLKKIRMINKKDKDHYKKVEEEKKEWKKHKEEHIKSLREIGNIHCEMAKLGDQLEFLKAIAIYECGLVHCQEEEMGDNQNMKDELSKLLKNDKREALKCFFQKCRKDVSRSTLEHMLQGFLDDEKANEKKLKDIRDELKEKIKSMDTETDKYNFYSFTADEERVKREKARIEKNGEIFKWIKDKMKEFVNVLLTQCLKTLNLCGHNSQKLDFAFIAFGSLSREETTPYSDVEFAVVQDSEEDKITQEDKTTLQNIVMTLHIKFLSFGETILPAMDIASLNESDKNDDKDWYFDFRKYTKTKQGISFDGIMPRANKTPYFECQTETESTKFCSINTRAAFEILFKKMNPGKTMEKLLYFFKGDFTTLCGNKSIADKMKKCFMEFSQRDNILELIEDELNEDFVKHSCIKKIYDAKYNKKLIKKNEIHVKKELYRLPSVVINNLLHLLKSDTTCVWDIKEIEGIDSEVIHNLQMTLSTAAEIRLRSYAKNNGQVDEDKDHLLPDILVGDKIENKDDAFSKELILRYFLTAIPLVHAIEEGKHEKKGVEEVLKGKPCLYDPSDLNKAMAYLLMNDINKAKEWMKKANKRLYDGTVEASPTQGILYILCNRHIDDKDMCEEFFKKMTSKVHEESNEPKVEPE
ncbi:unnamed protein product, partial [Owenia fusiformis]